MITDLLNPEDLSRLRNLQVLARNRVEGMRTGLHRSPHKGHSVEFREHRPYSKGDELRTIDWKVFGKSDRLFIRQYEEETNLRCHLLVDTSGSMGYTGTRAAGMTKLRFASKLAAALAYLMLNQQDSVGLVTFSTELESYLPPRGLVTHLGTIANQLLALQPPAPGQGESEPGEFPLTQLIPKLRRGGLVVVFSDCFGNIDSITKSLAQFIQARNDVVVFQILDRDEVDFPFHSMAQFRSLEQVKMLRRIDPGRFRNSYLQKFADYQDGLNASLSGARVELVTVINDRSIGDILAEFLVKRRKAQ